MSYSKVFFKRFYDLAVRYPLAAAATVFLCVAAFFVWMSGGKFDIGGLLGKLWNKPKENPKNSVDEDRKNPSGNPIEPGEPDKKGFVQVPTSVEINDPGILGDKNTVVVKDPEQGEIVVQLPTGIENKDVAEVTEVETEVTEIKNNDKGTDVSGLKDALR